MVSKQCIEDIVNIYLNSTIDPVVFEELSYPPENINTAEEFKLNELCKLMFFPDKHEFSQSELLKLQALITDPQCKSDFDQIVNLKCAQLYPDVTYQDLDFAENIPCVIAQLNDLVERKETALHPGVDGVYFTNEKFFAFWRGIGCSSLEFLKLDRLPWVPYWTMYEFESRLDVAKNIKYAWSSISKSPIYWLAVECCLLPDRESPFYKKAFVELVRGIERSGLNRFEFREGGGIVSCKSFWDAINISDIVILGLSCNDLYSLTDEMWRIFCQGVQDSNISTLLLQHNNFSKLDSKRWCLLWESINKSKLVSLNLASNRIDKYVSLYPDVWLEFCNGLANSQLEHLSVAGYNIEHLTGESWKMFVDSVSRCNLSSLDITGNLISKDKIEELNQLVLLINHVWV